MPINLDIVGRRYEPVPFTYNEDTVILYALGIGAGVEELDFVYEKHLKVFPTFPVLMLMPSYEPVVEKSGVDMRSVLHMEQNVVLHAPIPPSGTVYSTTVLSSVYDKGDKGAICNFDSEGRDESGSIIYESRVVLVDRSAGNFGGGRGKKPEKLDQPKGVDPDFHVEYAIPPSQHALYRLSGDKNPLHIDPDFARLVGFDRVILHGLCTYGYAGRAILHSVCGSNPSRFKSFNVGFANIVLPGETLIIEGWKLEEGAYSITAKTEEGRTVLRNGIAKVA